jgi:hypothetical protein
MTVTSEYSQSSNTPHAYYLNPNHYKSLKVVQLYQSYKIALLSEILFHLTVCFSFKPSDRVQW